MPAYQAYTGAGSVPFLIGLYLMTSCGSVTGWLNQLKNGDGEAAQALWERYFARLVQLASAQLARQVCGGADQEDVASAAFASFCRGVAAGRFPRLNNRHDLWRLLLTITIQQARQVARNETRERRDCRRTVGATELFDLPEKDLDRLAGAEPDPALAAEVADELRHLFTLLPTESLRTVARDLLAGYTAVEMAQRLGCSLRTVERRWQRIREYWEPFAAARMAQT
jgi:RNA polymerase sigma factor (sigma-70 family)